MEQAGGRTWRNPRRNGIGLDSSPKGSNQRIGGRQLYRTTGEKHEVRTRQGVLKHKNIVGQTFIWLNDIFLSQSLVYIKINAYLCNRQI